MLRTSKNRVAARSSKGLVGLPCERKYKIIKDPNPMALVRIMPIIPFLKHNFLDFTLDACPNSQPLGAWIPERGISMPNLHACDAALRLVMPTWR